LNFNEAETLFLKRLSGTKARFAVHQSLAGKSLPKRDFYFPDELPPSETQISALEAVYYCCLKFLDIGTTFLMYAGKVSSEDFPYQPDKLLLDETVNRLLAAGWLEVSDTLDSTRALRSKLSVLTKNMKKLSWSHESTEFDNLFDRELSTLSTYENGLNYVERFSRSFTHPAFEGGSINIFWSFVDELGSDSQFRMSVLLPNAGEPLREAIFNSAFIWQITPLDYSRARNGIHATVPRPGMDGWTTELLCRQVTSQEMKFTDYMKVPSPLLFLEVSSILRTCH